MINHIVKQNETIDDILKLYNTSIEELSKYNSNIKYLNSLTVGMNIIIPDVTKKDMITYNNIEPFLKRYYEIIEDFDFGNVEKTSEEKLQDIAPTQEESETYIRYYYPYFYPYRY